MHFKYIIFDAWEYILMHFKYIIFDAWESIFRHFKYIIFDAWEYIVAKRIADVLPAQPHNGNSPEQKDSSKNGRRQTTKNRKIFQK